MSNADNLLRSGVSGIETLGRANEGSNQIDPETRLAVRVERDRSDDYDSYTIVVVRDPILLAEGDWQRTKLKVRNLSGVNIVVGKMSKVTAGTGYLLTQYDTLEVETTGPIYVASENRQNTTAAYLTVWVERDNEIG